MRYFLLSHGRRLDLYLAIQQLKKLSRNFCGSRRLAADSFTIFARRVKTLGKTKGRTNATTSAKALKTNWKMEQNEIDRERGTGKINKGKEGEKTNLVMMGEIPASAFCFLKQSTFFSSFWSQHSNSTLLQNEFHRFPLPAGCEGTSPKIEQNRTKKEKKTNAPSVEKNFKSSTEAAIKCPMIFLQVYIDKFFISFFYQKSWIPVELGI